MAELTEQELGTAEERGRQLLEQGLRAEAAQYEAATGRVVIDLTNGCSYIFPATLVQDLQGAADVDLANLEVDGLGFNLHWPTLDVDLYVPALISGVFGTDAWMTKQLARVAGRKTSPAKAAAARANGAKGGRPKKVANG